MRTRLLQRRTPLAFVMLVVASGAWWWFRPDALFVERVVNEPPVAGAVGTPDGGALLAVGRFHDVRHAATGEVTIHRRADGSRVLRFSAFRVDNGPDLRVWLVDVADAWDDGTVTRAAVVPLGRLKGNRGNQNYDVPADVDLARFRAVVVWCERFAVNFATAPLMAP